MNFIMPIHSLPGGPVPSCLTKLEAIRQRKRVSSFCVFFRQRASILGAFFPAAPTFVPACMQKAELQTINMPENPVTPISGGGFP
ncbi:hypothetical protein [Heyndrickxia coagulans]|uniref:hypothetical protein n=1 Tax=Heyndrickxia coagulans TaxID=1398 RepID=UPI001C527C46|nr:hypothetical protein [Heyndrickxia coagulans]